jgi:hypothetical protein
MKRKHSNQGKAAFRDAKSQATADGFQRMALSR